MDRTNTININVGRVNEYKPDTNKSKTTTPQIKTLEELSKYISLSNTSRNFIFHIFIDRYSILYLQNLPISCDFNTIKYNIVDTSNETSFYSYITSRITDINEDSINSYLGLLRKFVGNKNPPTLSLLHRFNMYYTHELISNKLIPSIKLSIKNTRDLIFQIIYTFICIYRYDYILDNCNIINIMLPNPITLEFSIGNIIFKLENVMIIPIIQYISGVTNVALIPNNSPNKNKPIHESYDKLLKGILSNKYSDFLAPIIDNDNVIECLISYLLIQYKDESNICKFDELQDKLTNKYKNKSCLINNDIFGRVCRLNDNLYVQLSDKLFFNTKSNILEELQQDDMIELVELKETQQTRTTSQNTIQIFKFSI